jgi:tRNA 5-methylaminomethyl-2-thiouridine biosynthesis bifunctional protein
VVLANAADALRLLGGPDWPIASVRGQLSVARAQTLAVELPRVAVAGSGYVLPDVHGLAVFGATAQVGDSDPTVRQADQQHNLSLLEGLLGHHPGLALAAVQGRTGWRCTSRDRMPVVGAAPDLDQDRTRGRWDQAREVPRRPGLFVLSALGSRGITWSALCAQVLASSIAGAPVPLGSDLLDAIDPARFIARRQRAGSSHG